MQGLNKAYFIGRIGRDPEVRSSPQKGMLVATLSIATAHRRKGEDGQWIDNPDWHRLTAFGHNAEYLQRSAHKGDGIAVECTVRQEKWTDKDGAHHYETRLYVERVLWVVPKLARTVELPGAPGASAGAGAVTGEPSFPANVGPIRLGPNPTGGDEVSEEIPF